jgi:hypothetical protein
MVSLLFSINLRIKGDTCMNMELYKKYKAARKIGCSPATALISARGIKPDYDIDLGCLIQGKTEEFEQDGFAIKVKMDWDSDGDTSYLGEMNYRWRPGAIADDENKQTYFHPAISIQSHRDSLNKMGYSKGVAEEMARGYVYHDKKRLMSYGDSWSYVGLKVEVYLDGIELASDSVYGIESDSSEDYFISEIENLLHCALEDANKNMRAVATRWLEKEQAL